MASWWHKGGGCHPHDLPPLVLQGWEHLSPYEYHPERGLYYHEIVPRLFCGTQPLNPDEVTYLREREGITHILNVRGRGKGGRGEGEGRGRPSLKGTGFRGGGGT